MIIKFLQRKVSQKFILKKSALFLAILLLLIAITITIKAINHIVQSYFEKNPHRSLHTDLTIFVSRSF